VFFLKILSFLYSVLCVSPEIDPSQRDRSVSVPASRRLRPRFYTMPHEAFQSGQGGGRGSNSGISRQDHGGGGGAGLHDGSTVKDDSLIKAQIVDISASFLLKELISGSHGMSNLSL